MIEIKTIASSSAGCCYIIDSGGHQLILECGVSMSKLRKALDYDFTRVVACFTSHEHGDHSKTLPSLELEACIPIYCTEGTKNQFDISRYTIIESNKFYKPNEFYTVYPVELSHDVECFGFLILCGKEVLFFATDTRIVPMHVIPGLTHLMIEANHSFESMVESEHFHVKRAFENHLDIDSVVEFCKLQQKTLKEVHLIHLSDSHADAEKFKKQVASTVGVPVYIAKK